MKKLLGRFEHVRNMTSNNGNDILNQFLIQTNKGLVFQSYDSIIAATMNDKTYLDSDKWDYSVTTGKYRNQFWKETQKETQAKIDSGEYELVNLN